MGQLGLTEMLVIFIVALLVFGPKELPELGKSLGKGIREFRKATNELKSTWDEQVRDIEAPLDDVKKDINSMGQDLKSDFMNSLENQSSETPAPPPDNASATATTSTSQPDQTGLPKEHV